MAEVEGRVRRRFRMPLRRPRWAIVISGFILLIILLVVVIWFSRMRIASDVIERELARRGVQATYRVTGIGLERQRLENVVLGDPRNPDLTASVVEIDVALGWRQTRISMIRARGVRLRGRVEDGKLRLGEVDKLLPPATGRPFRLPNQRVDLGDVQVRLDTPAGIVGLAVEGRGNLAYSFDGRIAAFSPRLAVQGCRADRVRANLAVRTQDERPSFDGPLAAAAARCRDTLVVEPRLALRTTLEPELDGWNGSAGVAAAAFRSGDQRLDGLAGRIGFAGGLDETRGRLNLGAARGRLASVAAFRPRIEGRYVVSPNRGAVSLLAEVGGSGLSLQRSSQLVSAAATLSSANGTPIDPIGDALGLALRRAGQSFDVRGVARFVRGPGFQAARIDGLDLVSRSGARLAMRGGDGLTYYWPAGAARVDSQFALSGGGFPDIRLRLRQTAPGRAIEGQAQVAAMRVGGASLQLAPITFSAAPDGLTRVRTAALVSGPFNDGRVEGLSVPIDGEFGRGGFLFGQRCSTVSFRGLRAAGLTLGAASLPLCPDGRALLWSDGGRVRGGASVRAPRLTGRLGNSPIRIAGDQARFELDEPGFTSTGVEVGLQTAAGEHRLSFGTLSGAFSGRGVAGRFTGGAGKLANVPLLLSQGEGRWSVLGGDLALDSTITVADELDAPRFFPLVSRNFRLTLIDNRIAATGLLQDPETGTRVADVRIHHALPTGRGQAVLDVAGITFDPGYQPEELTRLTVGVVALVEGTVRGTGRIGWGPEGTTSTGSFSTEKMNLAAPFGPVTGLSTTIKFTDLLGLTSAPGQVAEVARVQTGIDVFDGRIRYQLLPDLRVRVEEGRWPFAGGDLTLGETLLGFSQPSTKRLVFTVSGLDAASFVQQLEFSNISATGTFDGTLPMEFSQAGGRIVGGRLVARAEGGTLSYIGELTDRDLGAYGKLAFDALKSLRYDKFIIDLDGSLEGEFLARIELDGIASNRPAPGGIVGRVFSEVARIPLEFNINIRGPFRALIATARSFEDPTLLIQPVLPEQLRDLPTTVTVQPEESEKKQ